MNLHLVPDDKFVSRLIERIENLGLLTSNKFVVKKSPPFKYLKQSWLAGGDPASTAFTQLTGDLKSYDKIFVHFMDESSISWIVNQDVRDVYWLVWGADIYESLFAGFKPNDPETQLVLGVTIRNRINRTLYEILQKLRKRNFYRNAYGRVKYIGNWIIDEYQYAVDHLPSLKAGHKFFIYDVDVPFSALAEQMPARRTERARKLRVQLGQSATAPNNHASALIQFTNCERIGEVVIPASYGSESYGQRLQQWVNKRKFPFVVTFNKDYMSFESYVKVLDTFDVVVLNSIRPAGMGNFWLAIMLGKTVVLRKENLACKMLKELGLTFYYIDEWCKEMSFPSEGQTDRNRKVCLDFFKEDRILSAYKNLFG